MKNIALSIIISVAGVALNAEEFTIQTISAKKENSITPAFEKKVEKSALESVKKKEGSCNIVTVGRYDSVKKARADLAKAKKIAKDAFVRPVARSVPKACDVATADAKEAKADPASSKAVAVKPAEPAVNTVAAKTQSPADKPKETASSDAAQPVVAASPATVSKNVGTPAGQVHKSSDSSVRPTVLVYDRNLVRKSDIHEAIEYYKTSPYHSFKPMAMQQR